MKVTRWFSLGQKALVFWSTLAIFFSASSCLTQAQALGNNAVYSGGSSTIGSSAFVDASVLTGSDLCAKISAALLILESTATPGTGGVIDARGINPGASNTCSASPWAGTAFSSYTAFPGAVILLPAGTITLMPGANWIVPNATRIVGEGAGGPGGSGYSPSVTTLVAGSSGTTNFSGAMIELGWESITLPTGYSVFPCPLKMIPPPVKVTACFGVSVEDLSLNGGGSTFTGVVGIENDISQERSYVNRVSMLQMAGTGLKIGAAAMPGTGCCQAQNSGPYSSIYYQAATGAEGGICASILGQGDSRGIHGITCLGGGSTNAAIYLDSSNVTIEDAHLDGFATGILIGSQANTSNPVQGNVIFNVTATASTGSNMTAVIEICGSAASSPCPANTGAASEITDITIMGVTNAASTTTSSIVDQQTGASLGFSTDAHVGMYVLGESVAASGSVVGFSRFTTSPTYPSWGVGAASISGTCAPLGSLFSNINGAHLGNNNLYACVPTSSSHLWKDIE